MNYFNIHNLDLNSPLAERYSYLAKSYEGEMSERQSVYCYVEGYTNEWGRRAYRLRERMTNKIITFWVSDLDYTKAEFRKEIREYLNRAKREYWNTSLFSKVGDFSICVQGIFGKETGEEIEVLVYFCECTFVGEENSLLVDVSKINEE